MDKSNIDVLLKIKKNLVDKIMDINSDVKNELDILIKTRKEEKREFLLETLIDITNIECEQGLRGGYE